MFGMLASGKDLYIATNDGIGIIKDDSIHYLSRYLSGSRDGQAPNDMLELSPGIFVMATCEGLMRFNVNSRKTDTLLKSDGYCIRAIRKYGDYLFIGTYGNGYFMMKNGLIKPMPLDKNKYLLYAHCFINDDKGFCWISTNRGLFKAQLSDLVDAYEKNIPQVYYHYFGRNDGMDITEMNGGCAPCALVLRNKDISFPTMDGLLWVNPEKATPLLPEGNIFIDEIMADNKKADPDSSALISLSPDVHEVSIKVGFSAWCNKENIYLEYQLNNNEKWQSVDVNNGALIKLVNLPQGDYTVRIRKQNGFGTNNYSYKDIRFSIATPWYSKWWFFLLSFACLIGMLMLFGWFRTRQYIIRQQKLEQQVAEKTSELQHKNEVLEKNDSIKTRLISIISHDIVTPLKFLTVAGKNLLEKRIMMTEELQQETIREMANTSQELQLLSTNILNWIKYQNENRRLSKEQFNVYELVKQVNGVLNSLAKQKNIRLLNEVEHGLQLYQYFEPLKILVYNLVSNAINFSEQGIISISNSSTDGSVFILVKDEGVGMTADQVHNIMANEFIVSSANIDNRKGNGLGYLIIKDLLKMMGATMQIDSKKGVGTTVTISIPLSKEELRVKS
jgi:signal transduction histidine kinase